MSESFGPSSAASAELISTPSVRSQCTRKGKDNPGESMRTRVLKSPHLRVLLHARAPGSANNAQSAAAPRRSRYCFLLLPAFSTLLPPRAAPHRGRRLTNPPRPTRTSKCEFRINGIVSRSANGSEAAQHRREGEAQRQSARAQMQRRAADVTH